MNNLIELLNDYLIKFHAEVEESKNQEFYEKNKEFFDYEFTDEELTTDM